MCYGECSGHISKLLFFPPHGQNMRGVCVFYYEKLMWYLKVKPRGALSGWSSHSQPSLLPASRNAFKCSFMSEGYGHNYSTCMSAHTLREHFNFDNIIVA